MPSRITGPRILCIIGHVGLLNAWPYRPAWGPPRGGRVACRYDKGAARCRRGRARTLADDPQDLVPPLRTDTVPAATTPRRILRNRRTTPQPAARRTRHASSRFPATPALQFLRRLNPDTSGMPRRKRFSRARIRCTPPVPAVLGRSEAMCGCDGSVTSSEVSVDHVVRSAGIAANLHTVIARVGAIRHDGVVCRAARVQPRECCAWAAGPARMWPGVGQPRPATLAGGRPHRHGAW